MADAMTPDEIRQYMQDLQRALDSGRISTEEFDRGMKDAKVGIRGYTQTLKTAGLGLKSAMSNLASSMAESAKGASQYGDALDKGAGYLSIWMSSKGPWGIAGGLLIKGATAYANAVSKQSDTLFKSYQEISRTGATAAGGITELYTNMQKFGYGIAELGNLAALVQENADSLALLGGTVFEGTKAFSGMSDSIRNSDIGFKFETMGINVDNMNKGIAGYLRIQTITGQQGLKTQEELRAGAEAYILQQDRLTKITGASANEQQKIAEAALSEERFAASQGQLRRRAQEEGNAALAKEADKREELNKYVTKMYGPEAAKAFRDSTTGYLNSPESQKFLRTFPEARQLIMDGADMTDITASMSRGAAATTRMTEELGKAGYANKIYINNAELYRGQAAKDLALAQQQADDQGNVGDNATKNLTGLARTQRKTRDDLQNLLQVGIRPVTAGMEGLAKVLGTIPGVASAAATSVTGGAGGTGKGQAGGGIGGWFKKTFGKGAVAPTSGNKLLDLIGQGESGGNYNALVGGRKGTNTAKEADLGNMTIAEVQKYQESMIAKGHLSTAVGKYQMIANTLKEQVAKSGLDPNKTKFDQKTQDLLAQQLVNQAGLGKNDPATVMKNLAGTWAALPKDMSGRGAYDGYNSNQASVDPKALSEAIRQTGGYQYGGIASGPTSGYRAMLHGTEAVIPLPNGKTIPVEMPGFTATLSDQTGLMAQQLGKLDELVRVMQSQVNVSNKILQRSQ